MNKSLIKKYAKLVVKIGANVRKGDNVLIFSSLEGAELAQAITEYCYKAKAKRVTLSYSDRKVARLNLMYQDEATITDIPAWLADMRNSFTDKHSVVINILSEDPHIYDGIDQKKITAQSRAMHKAVAKYYDCAMTNKIRWTICAVPCAEWAKQIFPELNAKKGIEKLWQLICKTMRLDCKDSVKAWQDHQNKLVEKIKFLNESNLVSLHYTSSVGTDFTVGLPKNYYFSGAKENTTYGVPFCANMPTEEIFTLPHKDKGDGKIVSTMPLVHNGCIINNFSLTLKDGKIVDYSAKEGYEVLKGIIETDEGSRRLGEIALVQYDSPIQNLKTLFYNTLFDENASCHFAIGRAYPLIKDVENMTEEEQKEAGVNFSDVHVDFMVGASDLNIVGTTADGKKIQIFKDGNFCI